MAIATLTANETGANSLIDINANFVDLDTTKADLASPVFTGSPTLPTGTVATTQSANDNSTKVATTAYADARATGFSTTEVFNGTSPAAFTDLDLSSVVGTAQRMVLLKFISSGGNVGIAIKTNGDADSYEYNGGFSGISNVLLTANKAGTTIVKTDTSGVIEWYTSSAQAFTVDVLAYW